MAFYYLYWDEGSELEAKLRRAVYVSLEAAQAQADADRAHGRNVVCIEKAKKPLGLHERVEAGRNVVTFDRGEIVG